MQKVIDRVSTFIYETLRIILTVPGAVPLFPLTLAVSTEVIEDIGLGDFFLDDAKSRFFCWMLINKEMNWFFSSLKHKQSG